MTKLSAKGLMLMTLLIVSMISMPMMVFAQNDDDDDEASKDQKGMFEGFTGGFGGMFGENMGFGGEMIGNVFEMLLLQGVDLEETETLDNVYVLSASDEEDYTGNYSFEAKGDTQDIHYLPDIMNKTEQTTYYDTTSGNLAYCVVDKSGGFNYTLTIGVALTLIIWDYDKSFITAAQKVLDWASRMAEAEEEGEGEEELIAEGVSVLTWLLVHINEIFTGDELFVFNPIVWQSLKIDPWENNFTITKTWKEVADPEEGAQPDTDPNANPLDVEGWNITAKTWFKDSYMQWLCRNNTKTELEVETTWTQFSFQILQLWMKKFYVEIDLAALDTQDVNPADVFGGCEIEFYLFTHHLMGAFLYNDLNEDGKLSVEYGPRNDSSDETYKNEDGTDMMFPEAQEISHQLVLGTVDDFDFDAPEIKEGSGDDPDVVKWGLTLNDATIRPVPVGVDYNTWSGTQDEELSYIYFGLEFIPEIAEEPADADTVEASGMVKLDHNFAPWNYNGSANGKTEVNNEDVKEQESDMAILYVSSMLHFDLDMDADPSSSDKDPEEETDYETKSDELKIGNYLDEDDDNLDFVDIAGPGYYLGNTTLGEAKEDGLYEATTTTASFAQWTGSFEEHKTHEAEEDTDADDFETDVNVQAQWDVMFYAVCYPDFNGTGYGVWHDPTFSVYMVFTPETTGFWALILLIAGVGLIGIATVFIKRRKDRAY